MDLFPEDDFIMGPVERSVEDEGFTEMVFKRKGPSDEELAAMGNLHLLTCNGGPGQKGVALVGDAVMTVEEHVAVDVAKAAIEDAEALNKLPLEKLTMLQLTAHLEERCRDRHCSMTQALAEIGRLQNQAIYGDKVRRR